MAPRRRGVFPDLCVSVDDLVAEGDRVVVFWTGTGTHAGPFAGIPATGKRVSVPVVSTVRLHDGKIVEYGARADVFDFLQQVGAAITPPAPTPVT